MDTQWILFWWARNMVSQMTAWQEEAKRKHDEQLAKNSETEWQNLYLAWLNATDPKAQQQNFTGANAINVWKIIAQAAKDHWSDSYDWLEPNQAISRYMEKNPDKMDITNKAIAWEIDLNTWANAIWAYIDDTDYTEWWLYESYAPITQGNNNSSLSTLGKIGLIWAWYEATTAGLGSLSSWAWKWLYGMSFGMNEDEARSIQRDNANKIKMSTYDAMQEEALKELKAAQKAWDEAAIEAANRKLKVAIEWHDKAFESSKAPTRKTVDTALDYDLYWRNKAVIWDKAKAEWELLFEQEIVPALKNSKQTVNVQELIDSIDVEDLAKWDPDKLAAYTDALEDLKTSFSDPKYAEYSMMDTQTLKSWIQGRTPQKFYKWKEITNELQELKWILGSKLKNELHSKLSAELWENTAKLYLDYANLMDIAKAWVKDRANSLSKWGFGGFQNWVKDKAVTPVSSYGWDKLNKIWNWLKGKSIKNIAKKLIKKWWVSAIFEDWSIIPWSPTNIATKAKDLIEQYNRDPNSVYTSDTRLWNAMIIYDKDKVDKAIEMAKQEWAPEWVFFDMYWSPHVLEEWVIYDVY